MIGRDGVFGASAVLGEPLALTTAIVQSPGMCSVLPIGLLNDAADQSKTFRAILVRHEQAIFVQAQQSAACVASHPAVARLARWLLRARDAAGSDELHLNQECLAQMLGVKRNVISLVAGTLFATRALSALAVAKFESSIPKGSKPRHANAIRQ